MGFDNHQLRDKALLALEEVVVECHYRTPRRSLAVRFALAYLWAYSSTGREPFDILWRSLSAEKSPWSFSAADRALLGIYRALNLERDDNVSHALWARRAAEEREASKAAGKRKDEGAGSAGAQESRSE
jgi:hypothetical protein